MTPDSQREFLSVLGEVSRMAPDLRMGQLLAHLGFLGEVHLGRGLAELEDDELIALLYRHRGELQSRGGEIASTGTTSLSGIAAAIDPAASLPK